jgi:hypothetical protein
MTEQTRSCHVSRASNDYARIDAAQQGEPVTKPAEIGPDLVSSRGRVAPLGSDRIAAGLESIYQGNLSSGVETQNPDHSEPLCDVVRPEAQCRILLAPSRLGG